MVQDGSKVHTFSFFLCCVVITTFVCLASLWVLVLFVVQGDAIFLFIFIMDPCGLSEMWASVGALIAVGNCRRLNMLLSRCRKKKFVANWFSVSRRIWGCFDRFFLCAAVAFFGWNYYYYCLVSVSQRKKVCKKNARKNRKEIFFFLSPCFALRSNQFAWKNGKIYLIGFMRLKGILWNKFFVLLLSLTN